MRPLDPLLEYSVVLPKTIPVGVSNDLMFSEKGHPFMTQTIHNLITFDYNYFLNYPTVMFSTGPMYVSAQYGIYTAAHPHREDVRVLSKPLYGKNASPLEAPHAFFSHHYGSSWHSDDAAFIMFLKNWGKIMMKLGAVVLVVGVAKMIWAKRGKAVGGIVSSTSGSGGSGGGLRRRLPGVVGIFVPRAFTSSSTSDPASSSSTSHAGSHTRHSAHHHHHSSRRHHTSSRRRQHSQEHVRRGHGYADAVPDVAFPLGACTFARNVQHGNGGNTTGSSSDEFEASATSIPFVAYHQHWEPVASLQPYQTKRLLLHQVCLYFRFPSTFLAGPPADQAKASSPSLFRVPRVPYPNLPWRTDQVLA